MVVCQECQDEMSTVDTCTFPYLQFSNGKTYKRNTSYFDDNERCHDCGIENKNGMIHHFGCDMERCPRCKGQLISCNCLATNDHEGQELIPLETKNG